MRLHLQEKEGDEQILPLFAYNQIVQQLAALCDEPPCLISCSEEELNDALLLLDKIIISLKITEVKLPALEQQIRFDGCFDMFSTPGRLC